MASGTTAAIHLFPTGLDMYATVVDRGVIISGESHAVPISSPYQFYTTHTPLFGSPGTTTSIPGFTEVTGTPSTNQYQVDYSGNNASRFSFSSFNAGNAVTVTYTANGDEIQAFMFNDLKVSVTGIEAYIISGSAFAGNVRITGSDMTGDLVMNGANVATSVSGGNQVGTVAMPFANIVGVNLTTDQLQSMDGLDVISLGGDIAISGNNAVRVQSNNLVQLSGSVNVDLITETSGINISAGNSIVTIAGHTLPTGSFVYDLGSSSQRWRTIYANDIVATTNPYVRTTGDTMTGDLVMATGASIDTDLINNVASSLNVNSSADINLNAAGSINANSSLVTLSNNLQVGPSFVGVNSTVIPSIDAIYDLGSSTNKFANIYADNIVGAAISGAFVRTTGDQMTGDLNMGFGSAINVQNINSFVPSGNLNVNVGQFNLTATNNIHFDVGPTGNQKMQIGLTEIFVSDDIIPTISGNFNLGAPSLYYKAIYVDNLSVNSITSGSTIQGATFGNLNITGTLGFASGSSVVALQSGTINIGTSGSPFGTLYVNNIVTSQTTGTFVNKFGDTMIGVLSIGTGSSISAAGSGVSNIGSISNPFGNIYANNIISSGLDDRYVNVTGDQMTGALTLPSILATGTLNISAVGIVTLTGNQVSLVGEQVNITSLVGPVIIDANTELQLLSDSAPILALSPTGTSSFKDIFPDTSGTHSLGTPQKPWGTIYALNIVPVGVSGTGNFVLKIGDTMSGNLNFLSGIGIQLVQSGTSDIGSAASPLRAIYANNIISTSPSGGFVHISGDTMTGNLTMSSSAIVGSVISGNNVQSGISINAVSGSNTLILDQRATGLSINSVLGLGLNMGHISIGNVNGNLTPEIDLFASTGGGGSQYRETLTSGGVNFTGNTSTFFDVSNGPSNIHLGLAGINLSSSSNITISGVVVPFISGNFTLGTLALPFSGAYFKNINGTPSTTQVYNEIPSGTVNGINSTFTTLFTPVSGTQRLYAGGLRQTPGSTFDYQISGNTFTFNNIPPSGTNLLIDYEKLAY